MIFAEKLIQLRKKSGWSQEDLAEQMGVTRQSVSKWEGAQSVPDLEKLVQLSKLLGVSLDYLLKDELEESQPGEATEQNALRRVTLPDAHAFLAAKADVSGPIALGVLLCVLSPICLLLLAARSEMPGSGLRENMAGGIGMTVLLVLIAAAVVLFLSTGRKTSPFAWLEKEPFDTEYGVEGMVKTQRAARQSAHQKALTIGVTLLILAIVPLFLGLAVSEDGFFMVGMLCLVLALAGVGAAILVKDGTVWGSYQILLQEEDYTPEKKTTRPRREALSAVYWLLAVAIYLAVSLPKNNWRESWIIWPVAGVLFPAVLALQTIFSRSSKR